MNLVLLEPADLAGDGVAVVRGPRALHICEVHRAGVGDTLRVGLVGGLMGHGVVTGVAPGEVALSVRLSEPPPAPCGIDLLLALPRPKMLRRLLAAVASMGVKRLILVNSARVEKSYFDSPVLAPEAIAAELRLGLSQACDTVLPQVTVEPLFRPFVEDRAPLLWPAPAGRLLAHPDARRDLCEVLPPATPEPVALAIGPEGGWVPFEVDLLEAQGFQRFAAGRRILRVDTAVPFLLGQCALVRRGVGRAD